MIINENTLCVGTGGDLGTESPVLMEGELSQLLFTDGVDICLLAVIVFDRGFWKMKSKQLTSTLVFRCYELNQSETAKKLKLRWWPISCDMIRDNATPET